MSYDGLKQEVADIIVNKFNNRICFLIGDNMTGKTEIANLVKEMDSSIKIFDNYYGKYSNLPSVGRSLVITHNRMVLEQADSKDKVIMLMPNSIYCATEIESKSHVDTMFYVTGQEDSLNFLLSRLLNNAVSGCWSDLNEKYLEYYKNSKQKITPCDEAIFKQIESFSRRN